MKAYLIDPVNKQVSEVEYDEAKGLKSIYEHTRCTCIDAVYLNEQDCAYVDDGGLLHGMPYGMFVLTGSARAVPLAGYGLVLGVDRNGQTCAPKIGLHELQAMVTFPSLAEIRARAAAGEFD